MLFPQETYRKGTFRSPLGRTEVTSKGRASCATSGCKPGGGCRPATHPGRAQPLPPPAGQASPSTKGSAAPCFLAPAWVKGEGWPGHPKIDKLDEEVLKSVL